MYDESAVLCKLIRLAIYFEKVFFSCETVLVQKHNERVCVLGE